MRYVVCIYPGPWFNRYGELPIEAPSKGQVYTVLGSRTNLHGRKFIKLAEIKRGWFAVRYFRPVQRDLKSLFLTETVS